MEISTSKDKSHILSVLTLVFWLEYLELEKSIWCKLNFFIFLTQIPINLPNFNRNSSYEGDIIFLRQPINSVSKQVLWRNKYNLLKCRLFTLERTIFIFFGRIQTDWRDVGIRLSYQIQRKRKKKERRRLEKRTQLHHFLLYPKLYSPLFYSLVFQWTCKVKLIFLVERIQKPSDFKKAMRSVLSILFSLYNEYKCFPILISYDYLVWMLERTLNYYSKPIYY